MEGWLKAADLYAAEAKAKEKDDWDDNDYATYCEDSLMDRFRFVRDDGYLSTGEGIGAFDIVCFDDSGVVLGRERDHIAIRNDYDEVEV